VFRAVFVPLQKIILEIHRKTYALVISHDIYKKQIYNMGKMIGDIPLDKLETQEFLSIEEVSKMFKLSRRTISKLIATQDLRVVKWGKEKRVPVTSVLYYLTRQGIMFPSEFSEKMRLGIYAAEKGMFDAKRSLTLAMDEVIKNKAIELHNSGYFDSNE
jgi:excisionase family DNA binding protein